MKIRLFLLIIAISFTGCKKNIIKEPEKTSSDPLTRFFEICRDDLQRAGNVIITRDIVKNLSHLQFMNAGGKRYYLLERENISRMIKAVTNGVYSDYILVNKKGTIIYTRENNKIFSKNVRSHLKSTPLKAAYDRRNLPVYISNISMLNPSDETYRIFISRKVAGGESFPGVLILQVDVTTMLKYLEKGTEVIGSDGLYHLSHDRTRMMQPCPYYTELGIVPGEKISQGETKTVKSGKKIYFKTFRFENRSWLLVKELK